MMALVRLWIFMMGVFLGATAIANTLTDSVCRITTPGTYEVTRSVTNIKVALTESTERVHLRFSDNNTAGYSLEGYFTDSGNAANNALQVVRGQVSVEIGVGVVVRMASRKNPKPSSGGSTSVYAAIGTPSASSGALTLAGRGTLIVYPRREADTVTTGFCIGSTAVAYGGSLTIAGELTVYLATYTDAPVLQNLKTFDLLGGCVYCVPKCTNMETAAPSSWKFAVSEDVPIDAKSITLAGGALLGSPKTPSTRTYNGLLATTAETAFTWTGGSYLNKNTVSYALNAVSLPGACLSFNGVPCTGEFLPDKYGNLYLPNVPGEEGECQFNYAREGELAIADFFDVAPVPTTEGMKVDYAFGLSRIAPVRVNGEQKVQLDVGIELPEETADTRTIALIAYEHIGETSSEVYKANVTFTRVTASEPLFCATITTSADFKTSTIGVRRYTVTAETELFPEVE